MKEHVLIAEDEYIPANDLRSVRTGRTHRPRNYRYTGRCQGGGIKTSSLPRALPDILLQDNAIGADLVRFLTGQDVGYIYISVRICYDARCGMSVKTTS